MFLKEYNFFNTELLCLVRHRSSYFDKETAIYTYITKQFSKEGFSSYRIETKNQMGFPDMLLVNSLDTLLIEAKMLKRKFLNSIQDDLEWQQGQIAFMLEAIHKDLPYALVVAKNNEIAYIAKERIIWKIREHC